MKKASNGPEAGSEITITPYDCWPEEAANIDQGLDDANEAAAPLHEVERLSCIAKTAAGQLLGGALGRTWGEQCELQQLWVIPQSRRLGIGAKLVRAFEARALERACSSVYLETFSFQAPTFYRALGYQVQYEHSGFPHGITKFHMRKRLLD